jgi:hypothetical protein
MSRSSIRRKVNVQQLINEPYQLWNEYVDLLAMSDYDALEPVQRVAHLVFWYESEVQNGGHLQYFENQGTTHLDKTIAALRHLHGNCYSEVLAAAKVQYYSRPRTKIQSTTEYVATALQGEFDQFDQAFAQCRPEIVDLLKAYLNDHEAAFIERVE